MPGGGYSPLEIVAEDGETPEVELFRYAAKEGTPREELICLCALDTGLRAGALAHMTPSWLDRTGDVLTIDVPRYERCRLGNGNSGRGGDTTKRTNPCYYCNHRNVDKDWLPARHKLPDDGNCWRAKSQAGFQGREIPILEDDTAQIVNSYFRVHDHVVSKNNVRDAVVRTAERAGILETSEDENGDTQHWPTTHDLRDTFGTMLAIKDFSPHEIKSAMGHSNIEQATDYIELSGRATVDSFNEKW